MDWDEAPRWRAAKLLTKMVKSSVSLTLTQTSKCHVSWYNEIDIELCVFCDAWEAAYSAIANRLYNSPGTYRDKIPLVIEAECNSNRCTFIKAAS